MNLNPILILPSHAFAGWAPCAAMMGIGMAVTTLNSALLIHSAARRKTL